MEGAKGFGTRLSGVKRYGFFASKKGENSPFPSAKNRFFAVCFSIENPAAKDRPLNSIGDESPLRSSGSCILPSCTGLDSGTGPDSSFGSGVSNSHNLLHGEKKD